MGARGRPARLKGTGAQGLDVLVMGMHRSGTSAVAGVLEKAGLFSANEDEAMAPTLENPAGFGERRDVADLDDRMLRALGWTWDSPPPEPLTAPPALAQFVDEGRRLVAGRLTPRGPWFLKDPRLSLLLPWWRQILLDRFVSVVVVRPPDEVAWSLAVRNGFPVAFGNALTKAYQRHLARGLQGLPVIVVDYAALVADPAGVVPALLDDVERASGGGSLDRAAAVAAIQPLLRRATHPEDASDSDRARIAVDDAAEPWSVEVVASYERYESPALTAAEPWERALLEIQRRRREAEADAEAARLEAAEAEQAAVDARARAAEARSAADEAREDGKAARDLADRARIEAVAASADADRARVEAEAIRTNAEMIRKEAEAAREQAAVAQRDVDAAHAAAQVAERDIDAAREHAAAMQRDVDAAHAAARVAERDLDAAREQAAVVQRDVDAAHAAAQVAERELRGELARVAAHRDDLMRSMSELRTDLEATQRRLAATRNRSVRRRLSRRIGAAGQRVPLWTGVTANPLFDKQWYLARYPDVRDARMDPVRHYRAFGMQERRDPNPMFSTQWYLDRYPDVRASGDDPLDHYLRHGAAEGRDPSSLFDSAWYLSQNPDVARAGINPLLHYLRSGAGEGRAPRPDFDGQHVVSPGIITSRRNLRRLASLLRRRGYNERPTVVSPELAPLGGGDIGPLAELVARSVPGGSTIAITGDATIADLVLPDHLWRLFPSNMGGNGVRPSNGTSAIAQLEAARSDGVDYLGVPPGSSPWVAALPGFAWHLDTRYSVASTGTDGTVIHDLRRPVGHGGRSIAAQVRIVVDEFRDRFDREPVILDWRTGARLAMAAPDSEVFSPPGPHHTELPYLDASIDLVAVRAGTLVTLAEAERVALAGVMAVPESEGARLAVEWRPEAATVRSSSVSIVIPSFNGLELVQRCLRSLLETVPAHFETEIIVVDDASTDGSREAMEELVRLDRRISILFNESNLGFIGTVNRGASSASNEILVLLNNDTILLPGWLSPLLRTFRDRSDAGAVGGKLIYPDGRLQEAGGIVFSDGSAANFGYGDPDPEAPQYSYLREVDYVSGALFVTPLRLFRELAGLDAVYGFGYYDDSDYCFKLRRRSLRAYFQPESAIVHIEGGTAGTNLSHGPKRYQLRNRRIFVERWAAELREQPPPPDTWDRRALYRIADRGAA